MSSVFKYIAIGGSYKTKNQIETAIGETLFSTIFRRQIYFFAQTTYTLTPLYLFALVLFTFNSLLANQNIAFFHFTVTPKTIK